MREIKFRMYDKRTNEMILWEDLQRHSMQYLFGYTSLPIMQYTGLHSKNDAELYEGDIIVLAYVVKEHAKCVICYDSNQARYKAVPIATYKSNSGSGGWTGFELFTNCEVIGNIYENPSLIGVEPE